MTVEPLTERLRAAIAPLHPRPAELTTDEDLRAALLPLFGELTPDQIWKEHVQPFLEYRRAEFENVYREHKEAPLLASVDALEFPILLERAENDSLALERAWPLDNIELLRISDAWGTPVSAASD